MLPPLSQEALSLTLGQQLEIEKIKREASKPNISKEDLIGLMSDLLRQKMVINNVLNHILKNG